MAPWNGPPRGSLSFGAAVSNIPNMGCDDAIERRMIAEYICYPLAVGKAKVTGVPKHMASRPPSLGCWALGW